MELKLILEAILFSAEKPLSPMVLRELLAAAPEHGDQAKPFKNTRESVIVAALEELRKIHEAAQRSYRLVCVAGAWQFVSQPEFAPWIITMLGVRARPPRLSLPALETLAVIAYRQPVTRGAIEQIRGVAIDGVMQTLLERRLIEQTGRVEVMGRSMTYSTTPLFLEYFGLRGLEDLPAADELRRIPVERPPAPVTADAGLATVPPEQLQLNDPVAAKPEEPPVPANPAPTQD
jgi:segregation and condensation protein B